jgi:hypothetical protein
MGGRSNGVKIAWVDEFFLKPALHKKLRLLRPSYLTS